MGNIASEILELKKERDAAIFAHYYVDGAIQDLADYVGDSFYLAKQASMVSSKVIVFCGVTFMGESAKILNPGKTVIMPRLDAVCPMALMATPEDIIETREKYDDLAVVSYINSTTKLKCYTDVCVTSSNAVKIVTKLPNKNIFFIPDQNLGSYLAGLMPEKNFIFNHGYCITHNKITAGQVRDLKADYPDAPVLAHPECKQEVLELADHIGSTSKIISLSGELENKEIIICTERGVLHKLKKDNPDKEFYFPGDDFTCVNMKKITMESVLDCMKNMSNEIMLDDEVIEKARKPLDIMLEMGS